MARALVNKVTFTAGWVLVEGSVCKDGRKVKVMKTNYHDENNQVDVLIKLLVAFKEEADVMDLDEVASGGAIVVGKCKMDDTGSCNCMR